MIEKITTKLNEWKAGGGPIDRLKKDLKSLQHPFGLLLFSAPLNSPVAGPRIDASGLSVSSIIMQMSSNPDTDPTAKLLEELSTAGSLGLSFSGNSPQASFVSSGLVMSSAGSKYKDEAESVYSGIGAFLMFIGVMAGSNPGFAASLNQSIQYDLPGQAGGQAAALIPSLRGLENKERPYIDIGKNTIRVGSIGANILQYRGKEPYVVSGGNNLNSPKVINPGEVFLSIHVNQKSSDYSKLQPLDRIHAIRKDLRELFNLLENPSSFSLTDDQSKLVEQLKESPIVGISHLTKIIANKGVPTWKIDALPKILQKFFTIDSQAVSILFGGKRKVSSNDVLMTFIPSDMRSSVA